MNSEQLYQEQIIQQQILQQQLLAAAANQSQQNQSGCISSLRNMPLTFANVLGFIPTNIWRPLKKFVTKDSTVIFDLPFKLSTKYTPALLIVMMCLSFANQFVRNIEIDCVYSGSGGGGSGGGRNGYGSSGGGGETELNDFCWNYDTFLVSRALEPAMRGSVTYPGVSGYNKQTDELLRQRYYKQVWLILGKLAVIAFLPYFFWKVRGTQKIKPLVEITGASADVTEQDLRLDFYLETIGFNGSFAYFYLGCKIFATVTPFAQWYYLCGFLGRRYKHYGSDVLMNFMDDSSPWPNPMDALFPKMAKCEWSKYGFSGDMEVKAAQCQLPMNNLTQWSFFIYWWWIAMVFFVNVFSLIYLLLVILPPCRRYQYRKFVGAACREDVEKARSYTVRSAAGPMVTKKHKKSEVINVNLGFGDWLVLSFIKKNLLEWQFRDLVRKMVVTENIVLQLKAIPIPMEPIIEEKCGKNGNLGGAELVGAGGHKAANMEIGFIQAVCNPNNSLPSYSACEMVSSDCDITESSLSPSPEDDGILAGSFKTENQQYSININPPLKIDRTNLAIKKTSTPAKKGAKKTSTPAAPARPYGFTKPSAPPKQNYNDDDDDWER